MSEPYGLPGRAGPRPSARSYETRRDVDAAIAARSELGPEYEEHIAAGLAERIEQLAAYRTAELRHEAVQHSASDNDQRTARTQRFVLGIVSLGAGIPITAISGSVVEPGLLGVIVAWAGIVSVNIAHSLANRPRR